MKRHYFVYVSTLFVGLPLGLATGGLLRLSRDALLKRNPNFLPAILSLQTAFWIWVWCRPADSLLAPHLLHQIRWALPALMLVAVALAHASGPLRRRGWSYVQTAIFHALPVIGLVFLWHFKGAAPVARSTIILWAILALVLAMPVLRSRGNPVAPRDRWDMAFSVLLVLIGRIL